MESKYERVKMLIFNSMKLAVLGAIAVFGLALNTMGQTLVTDPPDGHSCEGGTGVSICVENTVMGENYYVWHNGNVVNCIVGNGLTVCCAGFTDPGDYTTVPATNTVTVYVDPLPILPTIVGDFYLCGYYNLTTYVTYENLPTSDYTFTWQAFGFVNGGGPAMGFYALPDENTLDVIWGNADYGTIIVTVLDNETQCEISSEVYTVNVCPLITNNEIFDDISICYGTNACFTGTEPLGGCDELSYLWQVSTNGTTWMAAWCCNPMANDTVDYCTPDLPGPATYYLRRIVTGLACESISNVVTLTVYAEFEPGEIELDQTICFNTIPDPLTEVNPPTGGDGIYTYQWQMDVNCLGNWIDIPGATNSGYQPPALTDTTCYRRMDMNICDTLPTNIITINVWDDLTPGIIDEDQTICYNTIPDQLYFVTTPTGGQCNGVPACYTYQWQESANCTGTWDDIPGATDATHQPIALTDTTCYRVVVTDFCGVVETNAVQINVWDEFLPGVIIEDQEICYNTSPECLVFSLPPSGGACNDVSTCYGYQWYNGSGAIVGETNSTLCLGDQIATDTYYCEVTDDCGVLNTNTVTITVWEDFDPGTIGFVPDQCNVDSVAICDGTAPPCIAFCDMPTGGEPGIYTYQWLNSLDGLAFDPIQGATNDTLCPPELNEHTYYKCQVTNPCEVGVTNVVKVHVWDPFEAGTIEDDQVICYNTIPNELVEIGPPTGGDGIYTYQWQLDVNCLGVWVDIAGATDPIYQPAALTDTTCFRRMDMNLCDTLPTNFVTINVWDDLVAGIVGDDQTVCFNTIPDLLYFTETPTGGQCNGVPACYTYQWQESVNCTGTWVDIANATNDTYQPPALTDTTCFRVVVTDFCGTVETLPVQINVWDDLAPGMIGDDQTICYNTFPDPLSFTQTPTGGQCNGAPACYTYQWQESVNCTGTWVDIVNATNDTYQPPALTDTTCFRVVITDFCGTVETLPVQINVWDPLDVGSIGFDYMGQCLDSVAVCYNTAPDCIGFCVEPSGGEPGMYTYQWLSSLDMVDFTPIGGAENPEFCPPTLTETTYYKCQVTNPCETGLTNAVTAFVWDEFIAGTVGNDQVICYNTVPDSLVELNPATGGDLVYTYQWQMDVNCLGSWIDIPGATAQGYQPPALTDTTCFRRMDMNFCDTLPTNVVTINVWDDLLAGTIGDDQTICYNTVPAPIAPIITPTGGECNGVVTCYTYQWLESVNCTGSWTDISGATDPTYQPPALTDTICYKLVVTDVCGVVETNVIQINVWDPLDVGSIGFVPDECTVDSVAICYNTAPPCIDFCVTPSGGEPGMYTYQWLASNDMTNFTPIIGAENAEYCPPALLETTYYKCQVTNPCETGITNIVTAFVWDEFLAGEIGVDQTICYNTAPECLDFTVDPSGGNTNVGYTYQWYDSFGDIPGAINPTYCPPELTATETYYCEVTNPCGVLNTNTVTITVWDEFFAGSIGFELDPCTVFSDTICSGDIPSLIDVCLNPTGGDGTYNYQWQVDTLCNGSWSDIAGATNANYQPPALINPSILDDGPISYCFRRYDMNYCDSIYTNSVEVVVKSLPPPFEIVGETSVCAGTTHQYCVEPPDDNPIYTYSWSVTGGILDPTNCCDTCAIIDWGLGPVGVIIVTKENTVTGCKIYATLTVQINPIPNPVITGPVIVDEDETVVYSVPLLPNQTYSWFVTGGVIVSGGGTNEVTVTWGQSGIGHILISQKDNNYPTECCGFAELEITINPTGVPEISGVVSYNNAYGTMLNDVDIDLRNNYGVIVQSAATHFDLGTVQHGYYDFYNVLEGAYTTDVTTVIPYGGVNATDALAIKLHAIAQPGFILSGLPLESADVNASGTVNATDALYVIYRTINYISDFPAGDWAFDDQPLVIAGSPVLNNIMGQCYGDVNGSYIPTGFKDSYNYELLTEGTRNVEPGDVFELPVRVLNSTTLGAMSLFLNYQSELVEVIDVTTIDNDNMLFTTDDNSIRIAWSNTNAYSLSNEDVVATLTLRALTDITYDDKLIALSEGTEFADEIANVIDDVTLKTLGISTTGSVGYALSHNFPNPFTEYTDIQYTIPEDGRVVLIVYDILGNKISTLVDEVHEAGTYTERFLVKDNNPGVYIYEIQVEGETFEFRDLRKMVIK